MSIQNIREQKQLEQTSNFQNEIIKKKQNQIFVCEPNKLKTYSPMQAKAEAIIKCRMEQQDIKAGEQYSKIIEQVAQRDNRLEEEKSDSPLNIPNNKVFEDEQSFMNNQFKDQPDHHQQILPYKDNFDFTLNNIKIQESQDLNMKQSQLISSLGEKIKIMENLQFNAINKLKTDQPFQSQNKIDITNQQNNLKPVCNFKQAIIDSTQNQPFKSNLFSSNHVQQDIQNIDKNIFANNNSENGLQNQNEISKKVLSKNLETKQIKNEDLSPKNECLTNNEMKQKGNGQSVEQQNEQLNSPQDMLVGKQLKFKFINQVKDNQELTEQKNISKIETAPVQKQKSEQINDVVGNKFETILPVQIKVDNQEQKVINQYQNNLSFNKIYNSASPLSALQNSDVNAGNSPLNFENNSNFKSLTPQQNSLFLNNNQERRFLNTNFKNTLCQNNFAQSNQPLLRIDDLQNDKQARINLYRNKLKRRMIAKKNKQKDSAYIYFQNDKKFLKFSYKKKDGCKEENKKNEDIKVQSSPKQDIIKNQKYLKLDNQQSMNHQISSDSTKLQDKNNASPQNDNKLNFKNIQQIDSPSFGDNQSIEMVLSSLKKPKHLLLQTKSTLNNHINQKDQFQTVNEPEIFTSNQQLINYIDINDEIISKFVQNESESAKCEEEGKNNINVKETDAKDTINQKPWNQDKKQIFHNPNNHLLRKNISQIQISNSSNSLNECIQKVQNFKQDLQKHSSDSSLTGDNTALPLQKNQNLGKSKFQQQIEQFQNQLRQATNKNLTQQKESDDSPFLFSKLQRQSLHKEISFNEDNNFLMNMNMQKSPISALQKSKDLYQCLKTPNNQTFTKKDIFGYQSKDSQTNSLFGKLQYSQIKSKLNLKDLGKFENDMSHNDIMQTNLQKLRQINQNQKYVESQSTVNQKDSLYQNNMQHQEQVDKFIDNQNDQIWDNECTVMNLKNKEQSFKKQEYQEAKKDYEQRKQIIGMKRKRQINYINEKDYEMKYDEDECDYESQNQKFEKMENQQIRYMLNEANQNTFMKQQQIFNQSIMSTQKLIQKNQIPNSKIREEIPDGAEVFVEYGDNFNFDSIKIDEEIPSTRKFKVYKYKNPRTQRNVKILNCNHDNCDMFFRKWHNFFDHLRVHTGERPFKCHESGCNQSFTQKANLNKHLAVHLRRKRQKCPMCCKIFASSYILKMHMRQHTFNLTHPTQNQFSPFFFSNQNLEICNSSNMGQEALYSKTQSGKNTQNQIIDLLNNQAINSQTIQQHLISNKRQKLQCFPQEYLMNKEAQHISTSTSTPSPNPLAQIGIQGRAHVNTFNGRMNQITRNFFDQINTQNFPAKQDQNQNTFKNFGDSQKIDRKYLQQIMQKHLKKSNDFTENQILKQNAVNEKFQKIQSSQLFNISVKKNSDSCLAQITNQKCSGVHQSSKELINDNQLTNMNGQSSHEEDQLIQQILDPKILQQNKEIKNLNEFVNIQNNQQYINKLRSNNFIQPKHDHNYDRGVDVSPVVPLKRYR